MRWKSGASPKLATSSRGCTWCSATPSSCASSRSRSSASSTSPGRTWRAGTSGSMVRTSGAVFPRQRTTSWQLPSATHGGRFTRRCMRATPSRRPCCRSGRTHCSGHVRSMRRSRPFPGAAHQPGHPWTTHHLRRARTSPRARGSPRASLGTKGRVRPPT